MDKGEVAERNGEDAQENGIPCGSSLPKTSSIFRNYAETKSFLKLSYLRIIFFLGAEDVADDWKLGDCEYDGC